MIEHHLNIPQRDWGKVIDIEDKREVFWSDYLIDKNNTTARLTINRPVKLECPTKLDAPWDGDSVSYPQILCVDGEYRMYYITGNCNGDNVITGRTGTVVCMLTSKDGIEWTRPSIGVHEWNGLKDNNIVMNENSGHSLDNFFIFIDEKPDCPVDEKYKALTLVKNLTRPFPMDRELWCWTSADGFNFKKGWLIATCASTNGGLFDSMNVSYWDEEKEKYVLYFRGFHDAPGRGAAGGLRDIRYMESEDFKNWSNAVMLEYGDSDDYELYTNNIQKYYRAPHILVGFPTRYTERYWWPRNNDFMGEENCKFRKAVVKKSGAEREGYVQTDGLFMSSHDGINWDRFDEAIFAADAENPYNWIYGDGYPAYGMIETPRAYPHITNEISMYLIEGHSRVKPTRMYRYVIRLDGFASYRADYEQKVVRTKPLMFDGDTLTLNFKTSGRGYVFVRVLDYYGKPFEGFQSYELFGDAYNRPILFDSGVDISKLKGKPIRLEFLMCDADIYSFKFNKI